MRPLALVVLLAVACVACVGRDGSPAVVEVSEGRVTIRHSGLTLAVPLEHVILHGYENIPTPTANPAEPPNPTPEPTATRAPTPTSSVAGSSAVPEGSLVFSSQQEWMDAISPENYGRSAQALGSIDFFRESRTVIWYHDNRGGVNCRFPRHGDSLWAVENEEFLWIAVNNKLPVVATGKLHDGEDVPFGTTAESHVRETGLWECTLEAAE